MNPHCYNLRAATGLVPSFESSYNGETADMRAAWRVVINEAFSQIVLKINTIIAEHAEVVIIRIHWVHCTCRCAPCGTRLLYLFIKIIVTKHVVKCSDH